MDVDVYPLIYTDFEEGALRIVVNALQLQVGEKFCASRDEMRGRSIVMVYSTISRVRFGGICIRSFAIRTV